MTIQDKHLTQYDTRHPEDYVQVSLYQKNACIKINKNYSDECFISRIQLDINQLEELNEFLTDYLTQLKEEEK